MYNELNPFEFQLFDVDNEETAMEPVSQLLFAAEALWNPNVSAGYSAPDVADKKELKPLDPAAFGSFTVTAEAAAEAREKAS
mmetsp:Transcript_17124/g.23027  ORF Transcript_17124/g.23027 Transcript_17124/m.23027 type:complete len:82 (-) Transcript_17124:323-568(-)